jgi:Na+-translocating ferredoxin:NAD+ oxidoreductase RnfG subunit
MRWRWILQAPCSRLRYWIIASRLAAWRHQFVGKTAKESGELTREIKNISGATLSSRHLTEGVQRLLKLYDLALRPAAG